MKKIENVEVMGWEAAIRGMPAKGYRKTKSGKFECFVSDHSKNISLGTYGTEELAKQAVFKSWLEPFIWGCRKTKISCIFNRSNM